MNALPDPSENAATVARELAELRREVERVRAELARVRADVVAAEGQLGRQHAAQLLEANEQLLLASLRTQSDAETAAKTAAQTLQEVSRSAERDTLTELPNRVLLLDRLAQAIANSKRRGTRAALLFLDLDNFKQINDALGHGVGDQVLKLAARRLASSVRAADTVSRHGGDEFVILLAEVGEACDAIAIAGKVSEALSAPSQVGGHVIRLTASIGISIYPDDGEDADTLIDRADAAMYRAKRHGLQTAVSGDEAGADDRSLPASSSASAQLRERPHSQLREANEQLVLAALGALDLQSAAEQARRRQTQFMAVLAHELRNPLAPIRTAAELLGRLRPDDIPQLQAVIERQVAHMARLIGDLLDVSRVTSGKLRLERQRVDMAAIIEQSAGTCRPTMDTRQQHFNLELPFYPLEVDGDPVRFAQILGNLLDNASKYTQVGGEISISAQAVDDAIVIAVSDNGIGITAEALPNVFEPFVQDPHAVGFGGDGLGIGLTVVRELVEAHGGSVLASSDGTGLGSRFVVTLPAMQAASL